MPAIQLGSTQISYKIEISTERKTIGLVVDPRDGVILRVPLDTDEREIERVLLNKSHWLLKKLEAAQAIQPEPAPKEFVSGERFLYIGRSYRLRVYKRFVDEPEIGYHKGKFIASVPNDMHQTTYEPILKERLTDWYRQKAFQKFNERTGFYTPKVGKSPVRIGIKDYNARWGSNDGKGGIDFNWKLVMAPMSVIDYAIVHELCHLVIPSHSKEYWRFLSVILVDYEQRKEWLRINGATLTL